MPADNGAKRDGNFCSANRYFVSPRKGYAKEQGGAHARIRTGDLFLTKEMLYRLSYVGAP
jgi:hypothetical protein